MNKDRFVLYVGNKNYSSWSMRPWLCLKWAGIDFEERVIALDQPGYGESRIAEVLAVSPTGKVPALHAGDLVLWDSLAIAEWANEYAPDAGLWPANPRSRALARAAACEMHSGFAALRTALPMNIRRRCTARDLPAAATADIARIDALWSRMREQYAADGPWLFGTRSITDAFFTPVATRFRTYAVALSPAALAYRDTLLGDGAFREWEAAALRETTDMRRMSTIDSLYA